MLLSLAVMQLTASIPDSHPGAYAAQHVMLPASCAAAAPCTVCCGSVLPKMPRPGAYTGPQQALQLVYSQLELQRPSPRLPQGQQHADSCVLVPTATLLSELLPLLISHCRTQLQRHRAQQQQHPGPSPTVPRHTPLTPMYTSLLSIGSLLLCSVVLAPPSATAAAVSPRELPASVALAGQHTSPGLQSCVLHAQDALAANA